MFPYLSHSETSDWIPGPYPGVQLRVLRRDPITGATTVLRKFEKGITVPEHVHPLAAEQVYILSGEWEESGVVHGPGTYFHAPKGVLHGPHFARTEVVSLTTFDGPLTVASPDTRTN